MHNAREVQPNREAANTDFLEVIKMLIQVVTNQVGQQGGSRKENTYTSRIHEFLRLNPSSFTGSSTTKDPKIFFEELKNVFDVMHVIEAERVDLDAYQLKNIARTWFD